MKNSLLTAIALCCATSSTMPLWASAYENPKLETVEPNLATDGTGGGVYYVYHVATNKFLTNGNDYNTRLSVGDTGQEVTLSYGGTRSPDGQRTGSARTRMDFQYVESAKQLRFP